MVRRWWKLMLAVCAIALLACGYDRMFGIYWVGRTDLEVEFAVTDVVTGSPIPQARVEVHSQDGLFFRERERQEFSLMADADGIARKECLDSRCFGEASGLRFTDTFAVHLPWWRFRVVADGYKSGEWTYLDVLEYRRRSRRVGPYKAKVIVPVALQKQPGWL